MDNTEFLKQVDASLKDKVNEAKARKNTEDAMGLMALIAQELKESNETIRDSVKEAIAGIKIEVPQVTVQPPIVNVPEIKAPDVVIPPFPEIKIPEIKVPEARITVDIPEIKVPEPKVTVNVPEIKWPKFEIPSVKLPDSMRVNGEVGLIYDLKNPLPVILTGPDGKPYMAGYTGGSGGGVKAISDIAQLAGYPISVNTGTTDPGTLRTVIASDFGVSVNVTGSTGSVASALVDSSGVQFSGSNPLPIAAGSTLDVKQVSGAVWSTVAHFTYLNVTAATATTTVKSSAGLLHSLVINSRGTGSTVKLYDNTTDNGNLIATIDTTLSTTAFIYDVDFNSGLLAVTAGAGAADLTIAYT